MRDNSSAVTPNVTPWAPNQRKVSISQEQDTPRVATAFNRHKVCDPVLLVRHTITVNDVYFAVNTALWRVPPANMNRERGGTETKALASFHCHGGAEETSRSHQGPRRAYSCKLRPQHARFTLRSAVPRGRCQMFSSWSLLGRKVDPLEEGRGTLFVVCP